MRVEVNGTGLRFDVVGPSLAPDGAAMEVILGAGHFAWLDEPEEWLAAVTAFVAAGR